MPHSPSAPTSVPSGHPDADPSELDDADEDDEDDTEPPDPDPDPEPDPDPDPDELARTQ